MKILFFSTTCSREINGQFPYMRSVNYEINQSLTSWSTWDNERIANDACSDITATLQSYV